MMGLRFNVWERLAVAVTVAWLIGATMAFFKAEHDRAWAEVHGHVQYCKELSTDARNNPRDTDLKSTADDCAFMLEAVFGNIPTQSDMLKKSALYSMLIAIFTWLVAGAVYVVFLAARWALRGGQQ